MVAPFKGDEGVRYITSASGRGMRKSLFLATFRAAWLERFQNVAWYLSREESLLLDHVPGTVIVVLHPLFEVWSRSTSMDVEGDIEVIVTGLSKLVIVEPF